eukprot:COSAG04_NODE_1038_length_8607_cov_2.977433_6_plen_163_part_00
MNAMPGNVGAQRQCVSGRRALCGGAGEGGHARTVCRVAVVDLADVDAVPLRRAGAADCYLGDVRRQAAGAGAARRAAALAEGSQEGEQVRDVGLAVGVRVAVGGTAEGGQEGEQVRDIHLAVPVQIGARARLRSAVEMAAGPVGLAAQKFPRARDPRFRACL